MPYKIAQLQQFPDGTPIDGVSGRVTKQFKRRVGPGKHGEWSNEGFKIQDETGEIEVKIWNMPPFPQCVGQQLTMGHNGETNQCVVEKKEYPANSGVFTPKIETKKKAMVLINNQPPMFGMSAPAPAPAEQYAPAPAYVTALAAAPYQPAPMAPAPYQPPMQAAPAQTGFAPAAPGTIDFQKFSNGLDTNASVKVVRGQINEVAGIHHTCLRAALVSLTALSKVSGIPFTTADVNAVAATILIQMDKRYQVTGKGFSLPAPETNGHQGSPVLQRIEAPAPSDNDGEDQPPF